MEEIKELIDRLGLEEDIEHVIIPFPDRNGKKRKCYILKRRHIRIMYSEGRYVDYPLDRVIEATMKYPDIHMSEALYLLYKELDMELPGLTDDTIEGDEH